MGQKTKILKTFTSAVCRSQVNPLRDPTHVHTREGLRLPPLDVTIQKNHLSSGVASELH